jgi:3-methyladenine DNA glycosylase AlkD
VKKGVSWALRAVGRRSVALNDEAVTLARRLAASDDVAERWVGKDAARELGSPKLRQALAGRRKGRA